MHRQIHFILVLISLIIFLTPCQTLACSMGSIGTNEISIQTNIKPEYFDKNETCLDLECNIKMVKLDKNDSKNYSKNDFKIIKKLDAPLEIEILGKKSTITEKSFEIRFIKEDLNISFFSSELNVEQTNQVSPSEVKEITQKIVSDDISQVDFSRFKTLNKGLLGSDDAGSAYFYKLSPQKLSELEDQKNHPKGLECRYMEFELKDRWIKAWGEYRSYCKEASHGVRCNKFVHPDDFEAEQEGFHIIGGKYNTFNPTNQEQTKSASNYYQTTFTSWIKSFWFLYGNWILLVSLIAGVSTTFWFYRRIKIKKSNL